MSFQESQTITGQVSFDSSTKKNWALAQRPHAKACIFLENHYRLKYIFVYKFVLLVCIFTHNSNSEPN